MIAETKIAKRRCVRLNDSQHPITIAPDGSVAEQVQTYPERI